MAYHWPVKPFHRQHPVRGYLNDPRIGRESRSFHFGVDISAPDGTPVFAVEPGTAFAQQRHVTVLQAGPRRLFGYWHIVPVVRDGQAVAARELLGHIVASKGHVHFAEKSGERYRNPLRPGALTPYEDHTAPGIDGIVFLQGGTAVPPDDLRGRVDVVVDAFDTPPRQVPPPFADMPVTPARLRWRILRSGRIVVPYRTVIDSRKAHLTPEHYDDVFAQGTRQNRPNRPGRYRYLTARAFDMRTLPDGDYRFQVEASDTHGNRILSGVAFTIANA